MNLSMDNLSLFKSVIRDYTTLQHLQIRTIVMIHEVLRPSAQNATKRGLWPTL